jgi:Flp pilus assembly protein TadG
VLRRPRIPALDARLTAGESERGDTSVEWVLLFPVIVAATFGLVQGGIWFDAGNAAQAAANIAAQQARAYQASADAGVSAGYDFIADSASNLYDAEVNVTRTATTVTVTVTGRSVSLVSDWFATDIERSATVPVERWID